MRTYDIESIENAYAVIEFFKNIPDPDDFPDPRVGKILVRHVEQICNKISAIVTSQSHIEILSPHPMLKHEQAFEHFLEFMYDCYSMEAVS